MTLDVMNIIWKTRTSGARNNEKWGMKNGKRHIVFWRIKKY